MGEQENQGSKKAGYEYLLAYKLTVPIYDYTIEFCKRWVDYKSRTRDQMEQAARSGMQNISDLPADSEKAVNLLITLINQANYLIDKLIYSLKEKHMKEGGLNEKLYSARKKYRGY